MKKIFEKIWTGFLVLYILSLTIMTPYYNWQYAKEHGFAKWFFFGEVVASLKSTIWPYFVFASTHNLQAKSIAEKNNLSIPQNNLIRSTITGNLKSDIDILLPTGIFKMELLGNASKSKTLIEINLKMQKAIKNNSSWFIEYMKTRYEAGKGIPYHKNLGITEEEYKAIQKAAQNLELIPVFMANVDIKRNGSTISFDAHGKKKGDLGILDCVKIDLDKNEVTIFDKFVLPYLNTSNITDSNNGLKSKWRGYNWKYEHPKALSKADTEKILKMKYSNYKFTIGQLEKDKKSLLFIEGLEIENGQRTTDFTYIIIF